MSALELDESGARYVDELAANKGVPLGTPPDVGFFEGALGAPVKGLMRGIVAKPAKLVGDAAAPVIRPMAGAIDSAFGTNAVSNYFENEFRKNNQFLEDLKADPATTGFAGQVLHGLFDIGGSALMLTPEGAAVMEGYSKQQELIRQGVDSRTATAAGTVSGAAVFAGVKTPMTMGSATFGRGIQGMAGNAAVGVGANLSAGVAERGLTHDLLARAGYQGMAEQYKPYDTQAMLTESALGAIFSGGIGALEARSAKKQVALDAALTVRNALHAARDTAPGVPVDPKSGGAHQSALESAIDQLMRGEPVNVADSITEAEFVRPARANGETAVAEAIRENYRDALPAGERYRPSNGLLQVPASRRRTLPFDAPELNGFGASMEQRYGLPSGLINALKNAGEKSGSNAVSPKGAKGVMQFMDSTWQAYGKGRDVHDPVASIEAAAEMMRDLIKQYGGDVRAAIAHYNGGTKAGEAVHAGEKPPAAETQKYLARVDAYLGKQRQDNAADTGTVIVPDYVTNPVKDSMHKANRITSEVLSNSNLPPEVRDRVQTASINGLMKQENKAYVAAAHAAMKMGNLDPAHVESLYQAMTTPAESAAPVRFMTEAGSVYEVTSRGSTIRDKAARPAHPGEAGIQPESARTVYVTPDDMRKLGELQAQGGPRKGLLFNDTEGKVGIRYLDGKDAGKIERRTIVPFKTAPEVGLHPVETWGDNHTIHFGNRITEVTGKPVSARAVPVASNSTARAQNQAQSASNALGNTEAAVAHQNAPEAGKMDVDTRPANPTDLPEIRSAQVIADELPDLVVTLDDGTEITAREALQQADDVIAQAQTDALAFDAAINCFLRRGA